MRASSFALSLMAQLPTELWMSVFEKIDSVQDLWTLQHVSQDFRILAKFAFECFVARLKKPSVTFTLNDKCRRNPFTLSLSPQHMNNETITFGTSDEHFGFRGFGKMLVKLCRKIKIETAKNQLDPREPVNFYRQDYEAIAWLLIIPCLDIFFVLMKVFVLGHRLLWTLIYNWLSCVKLGEW